MEKLATSCFHCWPRLAKPIGGTSHKALSNLTWRWLHSDIVTLVSTHQRRSYHHCRPRHGRQTYPEDALVNSTVATASTTTNTTVSSPLSLWHITNYYKFIIHHNAYCNNRSVQNGIKLIYGLANKSCQLWNDNTLAAKCPLLPLHFKTCTHYHHHPRPLNTLTFERSSKRHICTYRYPEEQLLSSGIKMNKLVNNILRRTNSISMATESSSPGPKGEFNQLSQIDYKTAIQLLNQLQTNAQNIQQAIEKERSSNVVKSLDKTIYFLSLIDIEPEMLNQLNVVHVAGTKGKGSTCAFVESILRYNGYKTGFYSSPHLVVARERIRLNGEPISEQKFTQHFSYGYNKIRENKLPEVSMPSYFHFMTVMALNIFLEEKVDVAILEVGIGGEYDCTNVVPQPVVTGVTSLDLDHCKLLGDKIEQIAWQKSGIFKENVPAFTVKQLHENAMPVLQKRAKQKSAPLYVAPAWTFYPQAQSTKLGEVQKINASLAVQLAHYWICKRNQPKYLIPTLLTTEGNFADVVSLSVNNYKNALAQTKWFGRCEVISRGSVTYFLDAAHTPDSMQNCRDWFAQESNAVAQSNGQQSKPSKPFRVLIFNCTGERNPQPLLSKLNDIGLDLAIFTTNSVHKEKDAGSDVANFTVTAQREKEICANNATTWSMLNSKASVAKVSCITEAVETIETHSQKVSQPLHVLITGSVHLVGGFIGLIHPHFQADDGGSTKL